MCGITGAVWTAPEKEIDALTLDRMTDSLAHRGPDGRGTHRNELEGFAFGHRRLSIIDLAGGHQPMSNAAGNIWVTFNGEIYNYRELRAELQADGYVFQTDSDTETIVYLYEKLGDRLLHRLRGMFAFGIWDARHGRLFMARDRVGQKPLVYSQESNRLIFASEIKSLLQVPGIKRQVNASSLDSYLTLGYVPHPNTMFEGIHKLPPGHCATYADGKLQVERYWRPDFNSIIHDDIETVQGRLKDTLSDSVRLRLRSDVPLGAFLSGGIDSTTIVGMMQKHLSSPAKTYTIGFQVSGFDESSHAQQAANYLKTDHHLLEVKSESIDLLNDLVWHFDEPFADCSSISTWHVAAMTREHVTVALTGDGGDELFGGYPRYETVHRLRHFDAIPSWIRKLLTNIPLASSHSQERSLWRKICFRQQILRSSPARRYVNWMANFNQQQRQSLYSDSFRQEISDSDPSLFLVDAFDRSKARNDAHQAMLTDFQTYLPCDLLTKVDVTSMAHGLECRSPFLDHEFVELAMAIPHAMLTQGENVKPLLNETFSEFIPPPIRSRDKMGFRVPLDEWFRGPYHQFAVDMLLSEKALDRGYFRRSAIEQLLDEHQSGTWNHGDRIWSLLFLECWHRQYIDTEEIPVNLDKTSCESTDTDETVRNLVPVENTNN